MRAPAPGASAKRSSSSSGTPGIAVEELAETMGVGIKRAWQNLNSLEFGYLRLERDRSGRGDARRASRGGRLDAGEEQRVEAALQLAEVAITVREAPRLTG